MEYILKKIREKLNKNNEAVTVKDFKEAVTRLRIPKREVYDFLKDLEESGYIKTKGKKILLRW